MLLLKKRILALILSVLLPGTGQIYNGQKHKTIMGYSLFFLVPIVFIIFKLTYFFWGFIALIAILIILYLWNIFDACVQVISATVILLIP
jgi:hypothetical protein